tara:strand:+ start:612 stop:872 length:261 start_codon:yes stop_codon:yes gene_type:complete
MARASLARESGPAAAFLDDLECGARIPRHARHLEPIAHDGCGSAVASDWCFEEPLLLFFCHLRHALDVESVEGFAVGGAPRKDRRP